MSNYYLTPTHQKWYIVEAAFEKNKEKGIPWRLHPKYDYQIGDIVYIYLCSPVKEIRYKTQIITLGLRFEDANFDDSYFDMELNKIPLTRDSLSSCRSCVG